jgi:hypothetical protein
VLAPGAAKPEPLTNPEGEVSWLPKVLPGDDQGTSGACQTFAIASWCEIVKGLNISDAETLLAYRIGLDELNRKWGDGMTVPEGVENVNRIGSWFGAGRRMRAVSQRNLDRLQHQPLLLVYRVTPAWDVPSFEGCLDHAAPETPVRGYHCVTGVGKGTLRKFSSGPLVYIENSWTRWGWKGLGVMTLALHDKLIEEVWALEDVR